MPVKKRSQPHSAPALPRLSLSAADRIETFLMASYEMKRPPDVAARLLALIVALHRTGAPFPERAAAAEAIGGSVWGVDAALSRELSRGLIVATMKTIPGNVQQRGSVRRQRYYTPSPELLAAAQSDQRQSA